MRKYQMTLLAGVAAVALVAGGGFASAQDTKGAAPTSGTAQEKPAAGGAQKQGQAKPAPTGQTERQTERKPEKPSTTAQKEPQNSGGAPTESKEPPKSGPSSAQKQEPNGKAAPTKNGSTNPSSTTAQKQTPSQTGTTSGTAPTKEGQNPASTPSSTAAEKQPSNRTETTAQGEARRPEGVSVQINEQQRSEIRRTVIEAHGAPRVTSVDFDVRVGTVVPRERVHAVAVPETLVRIEPRWRGLLYFVYEDEVVIVDPHDLKIVAILPV